MPCGSTTCNSTNTLDTVSSFPGSSFPGLGWSWRIPLAWLDRTAQRWERRRQYGQLLELDDRMLADIGLSRTIAKEVRRSSLYITAWRDSQ
ncbi:DUF1127 domain-containing protein [Bradyrhizobium sp. LjRoot220]|uniref:DUF1127 domain-containing protein n=1 Tax=Bradyrhizobium sp. LjRoot220 TaxID=3342284 RepID=UPI003ED07749